MGIIDTIKNFFTKREGTKDANSAIEAAQAAAKNENYNQASIKAYYALEAVAEVYSEMKREPYVTAREFAGKIAESDIIADDELEPIVLNFEIAKYSDAQVSGDDYSKSEATLTAVAQKFKSGKVKETKQKRSKSSDRRRRPRRGGKTGAAAPRRRRGAKEE